MGSAFSRTVSIRTVELSNWTMLMEILNKHKQLVWICVRSVPMRLVVKWSGIKEIVDAMYIPKLLLEEMELEITCAGFSQSVKQQPLLQPLDQPYDQLFVQVKFFFRFTWMRRAFLQQDEDLSKSNVRSMKSYFCRLLGFLHYILCTKYFMMNHNIH